jgi:selenocysteine-specific elongation factor
MESDNYLLKLSEIAGIDPKDVFNVNVGMRMSYAGIMGHVDSGKTSLCRLMTQIASTAALDKNPQSQDRGITLDLGFSAFFSTIPDGIRGI